MGLDMYLEARVTYFKPWGEDPAKSPERLALENCAEVVGLPASVNLDYISLTREVAYWRKANQIHAWFVENVQEGKDECQHSYVDRSQLKELRDLCARLLKDRDPAVARAALPPRSGFFFGGTDIDEYYWYDLESTVEQLNKALALPEQAEFYYHSSW